MFRRFPNASGTIFNLHTTAMSLICDLPFDVWLAISSYLPVNNILNLSLVSHSHSDLPSEPIDIVCIDLQIFAWLYE